MTKTRTVTKTRGNGGVAAGAVVGAPHALVVNRGAFLGNRQALVANHAVVAQSLFAAPYAASIAVAPTTVVAPAALLAPTVAVQPQLLMTAPLATNQLNTYAAPANLGANIQYQANSSYSCNSSCGTTAGTVGVAPGGTVLGPGNPAALVAPQGRLLLQDVYP